jgi:tellurite resistance protein
MQANKPVPLASFTAVMGIVGLGLAWRAAGAAGAAPKVIGETLLGTGAAVFVVLLGVWFARTVSRPDELRVELNVAITASYLGAFVICTGLLAVAVLPYSRTAAYDLWLLSAVAAPALLVFLLGRWIEHGIPAYELTPAVFMPVVGNAAPVFAAVALGMRDPAWAAFSVAGLCWLLLLPIVLYRLLAVEPRLPRKMAPQLAILVSSPSILASAWYVLRRDVDPVFLVLAYGALFFAFLTIRLWRVAWGEPFNVAMWGWTFPSAALAGTFELAAGAGAGPVFGPIATAALGLASAIVLACGSATMLGWVRAARAGAAAHPLGAAPEPGTASAAATANTFSAKDPLS